MILNDLLHFVQIPHTLENIASILPLQVCPEFFTVITYFFSEHPEHHILPFLWYVTLSILLPLICSIFFPYHRILCPISSRFMGLHLCFFMWCLTQGRCHNAFSIHNCWKMNEWYSHDQAKGGNKQLIPRIRETDFFFFFASQTCSHAGLELEMKCRFIFVVFVFS